LGENRTFSGRRSGDPFFCHLVLQGGGTLGIAHLGAIHGLEMAGVRFVGLAGTSAGAIVALLMGCARQNLVDPIGATLLPVLETMPMGAFIDGPHQIRRLISHFVGHHRLPAVDLIGPLVRSVVRIKRRFGLNPGNAFYEWLSQVLASEFGVRTIDDLNARLTACISQIPPRPENSRVATPIASKLLKIIATALPYGLKLTFPQDLGLLDGRYARSSPALMARASMSVPLFFEPLEVMLDSARWRAWVKERGRRWQTEDAVDRLLALQCLYFVDGGTLSNFPIDSFIDYPSAPEGRAIGLLYGLPTIGISLVAAKAEYVERPRRGGTAELLKYAGQIVQSVRQQRDREAFDFARALMASSTIRNDSIQICPVDTGPHNWLNFSLQPEDAANLFYRGLVGAREWLNQGGSTARLY
jgi:NTE family protein